MAKRKPSCDRDCFNCKYDDCIMENISNEERADMKRRDVNFTSFGFVYSGRPQRSRRRKAYI